MLLAATVTAVLVLAYANGANDNFKGVATLYGCGTARYRAALAWATAATLGGSLLALALAAGLVDTFKGKGLVPDAVTADPRGRRPGGTGAALTVLLATRLGLPVSTTHALTGGLVGAGLLAAGGVVEEAAITPDGTVLLVRTGAAVTVGPADERRTRYTGRAAGAVVGTALDAAHHLSAGAVCFARAQQARNASAPR